MNERVDRPPVPFGLPVLAEDLQECPRGADGGLSYLPRRDQGRHDRKEAADEA